MVTWNCRRVARVMAVAGGVVAGVAIAIPALASTAITVSDVDSDRVRVQYSCDDAAQAVGIKVMVADLNANNLSAGGTQNELICDGQARNAMVELVGTRLSADQAVQVRVALVDRDGVVVTQQDKLVKPGADDESNGCQDTSDDRAGTEPRGERLPILC
ncbi:hypothetical protein [Nocardia brasiliensis]|uniref:hypothetical protein n=1 Tax=Nocardia brasiliensis TaxID=37326 RepID=UPI003D91DCED